MTLCCLFALFVSVQVLALAGAGSFVPSVTVTEPFNANVYNNGSIYLGKVGPGQTFFITISSNAVNSTGSTINFGWNRLVATGVPRGWVVQNSSENTANLSVMIKPFAETLNGSYSFSLAAINTGNYSKLGSVQFTAYINVTPDVFRLEVTPRNVSVDPGAPAYIYVTINNTGVSDNPFLINSTGIPGWNSTETVFALHHTEKSFIYPIYQNTPGVYTAAIQVSSESSPLVQKQSTVSIAVKRSILTDYAAFGQGAMVFPIVNAPAYAVMYLIGLVIKGVN